MKTLLPPIKPYAQHNLKVSGGHEIFIEESGSINGVPILFVHGGPGAGCTENDRRFFDPERYRIILFDQRGCGRSTPYGSLEENTTAKLIEDMEAIRRYLKINKWMLFGGSWGSTLSLLYAQQFPHLVMGMILRGVFLGRKRDLQWFYQQGANQIFPDYWQEFLLPIPEEERDNLLEAYYQRLSGQDELARMNAAKHWSSWEGQCATLNPCKAVMERFTSPHTALSLSLIETHYFVNNCFIKEDQILREAFRLEGIPGILVHGRYDIICPLENAYLLHQAWPGSELHIIRDAGHSAAEPGITDALVNAAEMILRYSV